MLIDIGVNFQSKALRHENSEILARAKKAGVQAILATGTSTSTNMHAYQLAKAHPGYVYATAGLHPHSARTLTDELLNELRELWQHSEVVAVGECGLDYNRNFSTPQEQRSAFEAVLEASKSVDKALFLHCRDAHDDFTAILTPYLRAGRRGVVHCFTESANQARVYLDVGLDIGITGWLSDIRRAALLRETVRYIPLERLHLETDSPYLAPKNGPKKSSTNEPANLQWVAQELAALKGVPLETLVAQCGLNSARMFGLES